VEKRCSLLFFIYSGCVCFFLIYFFSVCV
jgi:hypothetical protein